jgi:hypothetical protein
LKQEPQEIRERLLTHLRGAPVTHRHSFGSVTIKPLDDATTVTLSRHRTGEHRIYIMRRDPPKLLLRLVWRAGNPPTATHFTPGEWLDLLTESPKAGRRAAEPAVDSKNPGLRLY